MSTMRVPLRQRRAYTYVTDARTLTQRLLSINDTCHRSLTHQGRAYTPISGTCQPMTPVIRCRPAGDAYARSPSPLGYRTTLMSLHQAPGTYFAYFYSYFASFRCDSLIFRCALARFHYFASFRLIPSPTTQFCLPITPFRRRTTCTHSILIFQSISRPLTVLVGLLSGPITLCHPFLPISAI